jgi:hypothetical protein
MLKINHMFLDEAGEAIDELKEIVAEIEDQGLPLTEDLRRIAKKLDEIWEKIEEDLEDVIDDVTEDIDVDEIDEVQNG